jgi:MFS family permease
VVGSGLCGSIYVVCPPMLGEFTPVSQRGAVIAIYGAIYTLAGILAPSVMGSVIQRAAVPLDGYMTGFTINAVIHGDRVRIARPAAALAQHRARAADGRRPRSRSSREGSWTAAMAVVWVPAFAGTRINATLRAAHQPARTRAGGRAAALRHHAGDDGGVIAVDLLQQAAAADRKIVMHLRRMQMQPS